MVVVVDFEKGTTEEPMGGAPNAQLPVPAMARGGEMNLLIRDLSRLLPVEGGAVAGNKKMNPGQKKWLPYYWLLVAAASVILLNNHIHAAPKDQPLFPPELAVFTVLLSSICLISLSVKQMM